MIKKYIEKQLHLFFEDDTLLKQAFTHSSYANEHQLSALKHNERLEFLGDAVVEIVVSDYLFHNFLQWPEGKLTRLRAQLVCEQMLSTLAKECGFDQLVLLGKGEENSGGRTRPSLLCDVFEAFVGALYLEKGIEVARAFVLSQIVPKINDQTQNPFTDYKTLLQEHLQRNGNVSIVYDIIKEDGLAHDKTFEATVSLNGQVIGTGIGKNKKDAQQQAAKQAYEKEGF
ncbi:ribonuclease III [Carnobacteriaceae bacterium zg-ZUI252]|nr:ribonuclease III [Carnobacteriaceae bacterium zg-ZUI252]MBS4769796.1 ribonuclease III [Carnobacteriaceae bacterium zg-ZUI240]QTU82688.1 ribonuclease III [Carnobacteriaceae bacterium zg-C25]